jgi:hypothetical protein
MNKSSYKPRGGWVLNGRAYTAEDSGSDDELYDLQTGGLQYGMLDVAGRGSESLPSLTVETTQIESGLFNTTFKISRQTTIPSDKPRGGWVLNGRAYTAEDSGSDDELYDLQTGGLQYGMLDVAGRGSESLPSLTVETTQIESGLFNTTFKISRQTTIPSDKTEHKVTVALIDLSPEFRYVSVPRLSPYSFLQASATNSSKYALLAGPANIFLDNNFVAKSELSDVSAGEQFTSSLGVDQGIRITCQPVAVLHSTARGLSKNKVLTYTHAIKVKNTRQDEAEIEVSEQVPLSQDDRIKVQIVEPDVKKARVKAELPYGHAILNDSHNVEWHVKLAADTELELKLVYTVEHPPQDRVDGLPKL